MEVGKFHSPVFVLRLPWRFRAISKACIWDVILLVWQWVFNSLIFKDEHGYIGLQVTHREDNRVLAKIVSYRLAVLKLK